jgi:small nuclear ribonucleoprotein G
MDRTLAIKLNGNRNITGVLRGFDQFMNLTLDKCVEESTKAELGMVVRIFDYFCLQFRLFVETL